MAWPTLADLKLRLDIDSGDTGWDAQLSNVVAAAIAQTKVKVGDWDEATDSPDEALSQSALELAVELGQSGPTADHAKSEQLLFGHRRRFGIG